MKKAFAAVCVALALVVLVPRSASAWACGEIRVIRGVIWQCVCYGRGGGHLVRIGVVPRVHHVRHYARPVNRVRRAAVHRSYRPVARYIRRAPVYGGCPHVYVRPRCPY